MKIVVDAFGGDYSPEEIIFGVIDIFNKAQKLKLFSQGTQIK